MKELFTNLIIKNQMSQRQSKGRRLGRKVLSILLIAALIGTPLFLFIGTLPSKLAAHAEIMCNHEHTSDCTVAPAGHICSEEYDDQGVSIGCTPIYPKKTITQGHIHGEDCYAITTKDVHTHIDTCRNSEGELTCTLPEQETEKVLTCTLEETPLVTEEVDDTAASPIAWICRAKTELICEHKDCVIGEPCLVEQAGKTPDGEGNILPESDVSSASALIDIGPKLSVAGQDQKIYINGTATAHLTLDLTNDIGFTSGTVVGATWFRDSVIAPAYTVDTFEVGYNSAAPENKGNLTADTVPNSYYTEISGNGRYWVQIQYTGSDLQNDTYLVKYIDVDNFYTPVEVYIRELDAINNTEIQAYTAFDGNYGVPYDLDGTTVLPAASLGFDTLTYYRNETKPAADWPMILPGQTLADIAATADSLITLDAQVVGSADANSNTTQKYFTVKYGNPLVISETIDLSEDSADGDGYSFIKFNMPYSEYSNSDGVTRHMPFTCEFMGGVLTFNTDSNNKAYRLVQSGVLDNPDDTTAPKNGTSAISQIIIDNDVNVTLILEGIDLGTDNSSVWGFIRMMDNSKLTLLLADDTVNAVGNYIRNSILMEAGSELTIDSYSVYDGSGESGRSEPGSSEGTLTVTAHDPCFAAIGGYSANVNGGAITINGGTVNATNEQLDSTGAAIGGAGSTASNDTAGNSGIITINGGTVNAISTGWGAAIGGGGANVYNGKSGAGIVEITGGTVSAVNTLYGAGIGSGATLQILSSNDPVQNTSSVGAGCDVTITGGKVDAIGNIGAGIGGGAVGNGGTSGDRMVTITRDASVRAYSSGKSDLDNVIAKPAIDASSGVGQIVNARFDTAVSESASVKLQVFANGESTASDTLVLPAKYLCFAYNTGEERTDNIQVYTDNWVLIQGVVQVSSGPQVIGIASESMSDPVLTVKLGVDEALTEPGMDEALTEPGIDQLQDDSIRYRVYKGSPSDDSFIDGNDSLSNAISQLCQTGSSYTIVVNKDDNETTGGGINTVIDIPAGKDITLTSNSPDPEHALSIMMLGAQRHFSVEGKLTLANIVLDGNNNTAGGVFVNGANAQLIMNHGAVIQNCRSTNIIDQCYSGGGVCVSLGTMTMNSGSVIIGNIANSSADNRDGYVGYGGGVYVYGGTLTMEDGAVIIDNTGNTVAANARNGAGGGVFLGTNTVSESKFFMNGGTISENKASTGTRPADSYATGGGVYVAGKSTFVMAGGTISKNIASTVQNASGGGVYVIDTGVFNMTGGTISKNSGGDGGGVHVRRGAEFNMSGGMISKNEAGRGGGVFVLGNTSAGKFNMSGGTIDGNTASSQGGGVFLGWVSPTDKGELTMSGAAAISNNTAPSGEGGGIYTEDNNNNYANITSSNSYRNISIKGNAAVFSNEASVTSYPPDNKADFASRFNGDLLNNDNINYLGKVRLEIIYMPNNGDSYSFTDTIVNPSSNIAVKSLSEIPVFAPAMGRQDFMGWNTKADGSGTRYNPGEVIQTKRSIILYAQWATQLVITNVVDGRLADKTKEFTFWVYIDGDAGTPLNAFTELAYTKSGGSLTADETGDLKFEQSGGEIKAQFTLTDGQDITLYKIPADYRIRVVEEDVSPHYETCYYMDGNTQNVGSNDTGLQQMASNRIFRFINFRDNVPATGIAAGNIKAMLPLAAFAMLLVMILLVSKAIARRRNTIVPCSAVENAKYYHAFGSVGKTI